MLGLCWRMFTPCWPVLALYVEPGYVGHMLAILGLC